MESISVEWTKTRLGNEVCYMNITVSGLVNGNSKRKNIGGYATGFFVSDSGEILVDIWE